jgi:hypothetical protein
MPTVFFVDCCTKGRRRGSAFVAFVEVDLIACAPLFSSPMFYGMLSIDIAFCFIHGGVLDALIQLFYRPIPLSLPELFLLGSHSFKDLLPRKTRSSISRRMSSS